MENFPKTMVDSKTEIVAAGQGAVLKLVRYTGAHAICWKAHTRFSRKLRLPREGVDKLDLYFTALLQALILAGSEISLLGKEV